MKSEWIFILILILIIGVLYLLQRLNIIKKENTYSYRDVMKFFIIFNIITLLIFLFVYFKSKSFSASISVGSFLFLANCVNTFRSLYIEKFKKHTGMKSKD